MKLLHDLASVLNRYCVRNVNVIDGNSGKNGDLVDNYYHILQNEPTLSENEIAAKLYGPGTDKHENRYRKLRERLLRRMSNTLFFIDTKDGRLNDLQRAYYVGYREFALAKILNGRAAKFASAYFLKRVFKRAKKYELSDLVMLSADGLRHYYGTNQPNPKKYDLYKEESLRGRELYLAESEIKMYYEQVFANYDVSAAGQKRTHELSSGYLDTIHKQYPNIEMTYGFAYAYFVLKLLSAQTASNYEEVIKISDEGLACFKAKPFTAIVPIAYFHMYKLMANVQQRQFEQGKTAVIEAYQSIEEHSPSWFKLQELEFMLFMHTGHYQEAHATFLQMASLRKLDKLDESTRETWLLNRAYLYYLRAIGQVKFDDDSDPWGKFRVMKFLNNVPAFSKEKRGMNIPILILQILFGIAERRYDLSVDRIEAIEKYCSRYVRRDEHFRSNCFIKILLQFPLVAFHRAGVKRKAERYVKLLNTQPLGMADQSYEMEVIPYDILWGLVHDSLSLKFQYRSMGIEKPQKSRLLPK